MFTLTLIKRYLFHHGVNDIEITLAEFKIIVHWTDYSWAVGLQTLPSPVKFGTDTSVFLLTHQHEIRSRGPGAAHTITPENVLSSKAQKVFVQKKPATASFVSFQGKTSDQLMTHLLSSNTKHPLHSPKRVKERTDRWCEWTNQAISTVRVLSDLNASHWQKVNEVPGWKNRTINGFSLVQGAPLKLFFTLCSSGQVKSSFLSGHLLWHWTILLPFLLGRKFCVINGERTAFRSQFFLECMGSHWCRKEQHSSSIEIQFYFCFSEAFYLIEVVERPIYLSFLAGQTGWLLSDTHAAGFWDLQCRLTPWKQQSQTWINVVGM